MEKAPIKKFAVEARKKLKADVTFQLERYGITEKGIVEPQTSTDKELVFDLGNGNVQTIRGVRAVNQYKNLAAHVRGFYTADEPKKELEQFIEEIAYTWFNRLIAIRFMEVNRYLPVRVLSSEITGRNCLIWSRHLSPAIWSLPRTKKSASSSCRMPTRKMTCSVSCFLSSATT